MGDGPGVSSHQTEIPVHHGAPFSPIGLDGKTPPNMGTFPNSWNKMPRPAGPGYTQPNNMRSCYDKGHMMGPDGRCWRIPDKTGTFPGPTPYQKEITGSKGTEAPKAETDKLPVQQEPREAAFAYGTVPYPQMGGAHVDPHGMFSPYSPGMMGMGMHMPESSAAGAGGKHGGRFAGYLKLAQAGAVSTGVSTNYEPAGELTLADHVAEHVVVKLAGGRKLAALSVLDPAYVTTDLLFPVSARLEPTFEYQFELCQTTLPPRVCV